MAQPAKGQGCEQSCKDGEQEDQLFDQVAAGGIHRVHRFVIRCASDHEQTEDRAAKCEAARRAAGKPATAPSAADATGATSMIWAIDSKRGAVKSGSAADWTGWYYWPDWTNRTIWI